MVTVNQWELPLGGLDQARSLHRMLMKRKFEEPGDEFYGSPHIAAIQHRLLDMIVAAEPAGKWDRWRQADGHTHLVDQVRSQLRQSRAWPTMPADIRRQFVADILAPLIPSPELLDELTNL